MNLEQLFRYYGLNEDKFEVAAKWISLPLSQQVTELGAGNFGNVYDLHNGQVLKLTGDISETKTSMHLLHKHHPNVAEITKIAKYIKKFTTAVYTETYYFILQKKYSPSQLTKSIYNMIFYELNMEKESSYPRATTETYQYIPEGGDAKRAVVSKVLQELGLSAQSALLHVYTNLLKDIRAGLEFLHHNNVEFDDAHFKNIMFDRATNNFVIVDLGGDSSSPQKAEPEEIVETKIFRKLLSLYRKA